MGGVFSFALGVFLFMVPVCALAQQLSHGTSIAIVRTDDEIVIAADSRVVDGLGRPQPDICKIGSAGNWHFAMFGLGGVKGTSLFPLVKNSLVKAGGINEQLQNVFDIIQPKLIGSDVLSEQDVRAFITENHGTILGIVIFGYEQNTLMLGSVNFMLSINQNVTSERHICPGDCPQIAGVLAPSQDSSRFDWKSPTQTAVRKFVQMEVDKGLPSIGPPVQLMRIGRDGHAEWIEQPDVCREQR